MHCDYNAFRAEVMALMRGLELAKNLQKSNLMIQLDSLTCVQAVRSGTSSCGGCAHLIRCCLSLIKRGGLGDEGGPCLPGR